MGHILLWKAGEPRFLRGLGDSLFLVALLLGSIAYALGSYEEASKHTVEPGASAAPCGEAQNSGGAPEESEPANKSSEVQEVKRPVRSILKRPVGDRGLALPAVKPEEPVEPEAKRIRLRKKQATDRPVPVEAERVA